MDNIVNILVVVAHPDDEVLAFGGSILKARAEGHDVKVAFCNPGARAKAPDGVVVLSIPIQGVAATEIHFLDTIPIDDLTRQIEKEISDSHSSQVWTHWRGDLNTDHRRVHNAVMIACRPVNRSWSIEVRCGEVPGSTEWGPEPFVPNVYVDIGQYLYPKLDWLEKDYKAEMRDFPHPRSQTAIIACARKRGSECGRPAAEAFVLMRRVE